MGFFPLSYWNLLTHPGLLSQRLAFLAKFQWVLAVSSSLHLFFRGGLTCKSCSPSTSFPPPPYFTLKCWKPSQTGLFNFCRCCCSLLHSSSFPFPLGRCVRVGVSGWCTQNNFAELCFTRLSFCGLSRPKTPRKLGKLMPVCVAGGLCLTLALQVPSSQLPVMVFADCDLHFPTCL